nr:peptidase U32 family protein [Gemella sp. zg-1178]
MTVELVVTPKSIDHIYELINVGADAFVIGEEKFGLRLAGEFDREDLKRAIQIIHQAGKKAYVSANAIFHNKHLEELVDYLKYVDTLSPDAVIYGEPTIITIVREEKLNFKLQWDPHTLATNSFSCNYWGKRGAYRTCLSKELTIEEIEEIAVKSEYELEVQVQGMLCMFQSIRSLVDNYFLYSDKEEYIEKYSNSKKLFLYSKDRNERYPIFEDSNGTHIMSANDICAIEYLDRLISSGVTALKIDGILKSEDYITEVTTIYRDAIDLYYEDEESYQEEKKDFYDDIERIKPKYRNIDLGFFNKKTIY